MADRQKNQPVAITATPNVINVFSRNPQLSFTAAQLQGISSNRITWVDYGCITTIRYQNGDEDISYVAFDTGRYLTVSTASNLNKFRETFEKAACCGYRVDACYDSEKKVIFMVNVHPCECTCDKRDDPNVLVPPVVTLPPGTVGPIVP